jgi:dUTP pyrophosphatase
MEIKIKKLYEDSKIPTKGSEYAAGFDLYAYIPESDGGKVKIPPHETRMIGTGVAIRPPENTFGAIFPRSGLASKQGLRNANCVGVCYIDYTGEYKVAMHNDSQFTAWISNGERIAQVVFIPYITGDFVEVDSLDPTERGSAGFGSTGLM